MYKNNSIKKYRRLSTSKITQKGSGLKGAKLGRSIKRTVRRSAERMRILPKKKMGSKQAQVEYRKLKKAENSPYQAAKDALEEAAKKKKN